MNNTQSKHILITGATGFIGTNLCLKLLKDNHKIIALDNHVSSDARNITVIKNFMAQHHISDTNFIFVNHDIIQPLTDLFRDNSLKQNLLNQPLDFIYNLACPASPPRYQQDPIFTFKTSIWGVENIAQLAFKFNAKIIHSSTSEVYGDALVHPQAEDYFGNVNPVGARSCYDEGKRASETLLHGYYERHNLRATIIRIFNTYGPYMDKDDGRVVSNFINQAISGQDITIYGDGSQTRSFCYIDDLIAILSKFIEIDDNFLGPINLGNPNEFKVRELAELVIELTNSSSKIIYQPLPQDDPKQRRPDISLVKKRYQWQPQIDLETGLKKTIEYFSNNNNLRK